MNDLYLNNEQLNKLYDQLYKENQYYKKMYNIKLQKEKTPEQEINKITLDKMYELVRIKYFNGSTPNKFVNFHSGYYYLFHPNSLINFLASNPLLPPRDLRTILSDTIIELTNKKMSFDLNLIAEIEEKYNQNLSSAVLNSTNYQSFAKYFGSNEIDFSGSYNKWDLEYSKKRVFPSNDKSHFFLSIFCQEFFGDHPCNLGLNLYTLKEFKESFPKNITPETNVLIDLYEKLLVFDNFSNSLNPNENELCFRKFKELFVMYKEKYANGQLKEMLYDQHQIALKTTAKNIIENLSDYTSLPMKDKEGVHCFTLNESDDKYSLLISNTSIYRDSTNKHLPHFPYINKENGSLVSTSIISNNESVKTFFPTNQFISFVYSKIDSNKIVEINTFDNYIENPNYNPYNYKLFANQYVSYINHINSSKIKDYNNENIRYPYDEINLQNKTKPSGLFCVNNPTETELKFAKDNNLDIIIFIPDKSSESVLAFGETYANDNTLSHRYRENGNV